VNVLAEEAKGLRLSDDPATPHSALHTPHSPYEFLKTFSSSRARVQGLGLESLTSPRRRLACSMPIPTEPIVASPDPRSSSRRCSTSPRSPLARSVRPPPGPAIHDTIRRFEQPSPPVITTGADETQLRHVSDPRAHEPRTRPASLSLSPTDTLGAPQADRRPFRYQDVRDSYLGERRAHATCPSSRR